MARIITITSGKGGVGKTTTAINLAAAFYHKGKDVLLLDANLTTPNVALNLGAASVPVSLNTVLAGKASLHEAIYSHKGIKIIPSSLSLHHLRGIKPEHLSNITEKLEKVCNIAILDSAAGLGREALAAIAAANEIIVVTQPEFSAITDALKTIKLAEKMKKKILGVVLTRVQRKKYELQQQDIEALLDSRIIGVIPEDRAVKQAAKLRQAVLHAYPRSAASLAYNELAAYLLGERKRKPRQKFLAALRNFLSKKI